MLDYVQRSNGNIYDNRAAGVSSPMSKNGPSACWKISTQQLGYPVSSDGISIPVGEFSSVVDDAADLEDENHSFDAVDVAKEDTVDVAKEESENDNGDSTMLITNCVMNMI